MKFWKMHGLGNDYIVIDNRAGQIEDAEANDLSRQLCERKFSVGADGLLLVSNSNKADVRMRILNSDGSEAEMCGNGIRCFAKYCFENNIVNKNELIVETLAGLKEIWLMIDKGIVKSVKVDMGAPILERSQIPMIGEGACVNEDLDINGVIYRVTSLSVGNPHCVLFSESIKDSLIQNIGPEIENHNLFPKRTNVEFVQILNKDELKVRVWERGVGETLACGTGACAAVVAGNLLKKVGSKVQVHLLGGDLEVEYNKRLLLTGPAEKVFEGKLF